MIRVAIAMKQVAHFQHSHVVQVDHRNDAQFAIRSTYLGILQNTLSTCRTPYLV